MAIVNPYLKKKQAAPRPPTSGAGRSTTGSGVTQTTPKATKPNVNKVAVAARTVATVPKATVPPRVTPQKAGHNVASGNIQSSTVTVKGSAGKAMATVTPPKAMARSGKKKSLKQQLKQQIASLKRQKQLHKLQVEANVRRKRIQEEKAQKEAIHQAYMAQRQAEKERKLKERQALLLAKEEAQRLRQIERQRMAEIKQQERLAKQQAKEAQLAALEAERQKAKADYEQACAQYDKEIQTYHQKHKLWLSQRRDWMQGAAAARALSYGTAPFHMGANGRMPLPIAPNQIAPAPVVNATPNVAPGNTVLPLPHSTNQVVIPSTQPLQTSNNNDLVQSTQPHPPIVQPTFPNGQPIPPAALWHLNGVPTATGFAPQAWNFPQNFDQPSHGLLYPSPSSFMVMPTHLRHPPLPPMRPKKPRCLQVRAPRKPRVEDPMCQTLCTVLEPPSPYAATHVLLSEEIILVRPANQNSFGVNLKAVATSILVFPDQKLWPVKKTEASTMEVEILQENTEQSPAKTTSMDTTSGPQANSDVVNHPSSAEESTVKDALQTPTDSSGVEESNVILNTITTDGKDPSGELQEVNKESQPMESKIAQDIKSSEDACAKDKTMSNPQDDDSPPTNLEMATQTPVEASNSAHGDLHKVEKAAANALDTKEATPAVQVATSTTTDPQAASDATEFDKIDKPAPEKAISQAPEGKTGTVASLPPAVPKRQRRRRVNFSVMMVIDASKQNDRWKNIPTEKTADATGADEKESKRELLQANDIIVSIGGVDIAGMSFQQACQVFASQSVTSEDGTEVRATVIIARKKPPVKTHAVANVHAQQMATQAKALAPDTKVPTDSSQGTVEVKPETKPITLATPLFSVRANHSLQFTPVETAYLADCVIQSIHHAERLLGQSYSFRLFHQTTFLFRQVAALKNCVLGHRSTETLQKKWLDLVLGIETGLAERAQSGWSKAMEEELGSSSFRPAFKSEAGRAALRQLPRPLKGCRCQSQGHEYLHDIRCSLYADIAKHLTPEEKRSLQYDPSESGAPKKASTDKDLNVVEAAYKDRMLKLKEATSMEEAEARFVARMEEIQVFQLRKAILAPNLTSIVLSTIMDLQREFPKSMSDNIAEVDAIYEDGMTGEKRSASESTPSPKKAKTTKPAVEHLSFKYLMRMAEHIGKTWGHVYREPSHEDYAWRWELFHGHHSENVQWESHAQNPRKPGSMPFSNWKYGLETFGSSARSRLAKASQGISQFEAALQKELATQLLNCQAATSAATKPEPTSPVQGSLSGDLVKPDATPSTTSSMETTKPATNEKVDVEDGSKATMDLSMDTVELLCIAANLLTPTSSGLYDELLALVRMGVVDLHRGIPRLANDWASQVDVVILEDMAQGWGSEADPNSHHCISMELKDALEEQWLKTNNSWVLSEDPEDIIFDMQELDEWRQAFEGQQEEKAMISEGIGRFGL